MPPLSCALWLFALSDTIWKKRMTALVAEKQYQADTNQVVQVCKFLSSSVYTGKNYDITMAMLSAPLKQLLFMVSDSSRKERVYPIRLMCSLLLLSFT
jgi:hypothetical protein